MCQSIADGGRRCFTHEMDASAKKWLKEMSKAKKARDKEALQKAKREYCLTEEGVEELEELGEYEKADKFRNHRNKLIDEYNAKWNYDMPHMESRPVRQERRRKQAALNTKKPMWSRAGNHRDTGTKFNPQGWSKDKLHEATGTRYDPEGYDSEGYGVDGYHRLTGRNRTGYNRAGYDKFDRDIGGYHRVTGLNKQGWDKAGYNADGWHRTGSHHRDTGTNLDPQGFDINDWSPELRMFRHEWEARQSATMEPANV